MKLNIGSNTVRFEGFLNVDIRQLDEVDIVDDVSVLGKIKDNSVEYIIAHNILEHFSQDRVRDIVKTWVKKLKNNGVIEIGVPDGELIFNRYLNGILTRGEYKECPWEDVIHSIFGNIRLLRAWHGDDAEKYMHHILFNKDFLQKIMLESGLSDIEEIKRNHKDTMTFKGIRKIKKK